jgi:hypothetical protein
MRTIICRFADESDFFRHLRAGKQAWGESNFSLLGAYDLREGEAVEIVALVSSVRERCRFRVEVADQRAVAVDTSGAPRGTARRFCYRCEILDEDEVWLEMFVQKLQTLRRVQPQRQAG